MAKYIVARTDGTPIPGDEPCFVIRAKDAFAVKAIREYMRLTDAVVPDAMMGELWEHLHRMERWRLDNPDKIKIPD